MLRSVYLKQKAVLPNLVGWLSEDCVIVGGGFDTGCSSQNSLSHSKSAIQLAVPFPDYPELTQVCHTMPKNARPALRARAGLSQCPCNPLGSVLFASGRVPKAMSNLTAWILPGGVRARSGGREGQGLAATSPAASVELARSSGLARPRRTDIPEKRPR